MAGSCAVRWAAPALAFLSALLLPICASSIGAREALTPIQNVIQLLEGLLQKGKDAKHEEEVGFAKFQEWCDSVRTSTTSSIAEATTQVEQLEADIAKAESDAEVLGGEVSELQAAIVKAQGEIKAATAVREKEKADYDAQHADFSESISAIASAIQILKAKSADVPQSLLQVQRLPLVPARTKAMLTSFLALAESTREATSAPEANAYEFQSSSVVDMLEKLGYKFEDQITALEKEEMNAKANYEMLMQQLTDNVKADSDTASEKSQARTKRLEDAAGAKGELGLTTKRKADDEATLKDTTTECHAKSTEFEQNQVLRAGEVQAIEKALEILGSDEVKGSAEKYLPGAALLQGKGTSLAQLRRGAPTETTRLQKAAAYLEERATRTGSHYLSVMAEHTAADPFARVKKMIKDLLVKLMEEANEEADHHSYCQWELATNKQTRTNKAAEAEKLSAEVDGLTTEIAQLKGSVQELSDAIAEIREKQAEGQALRAADKADNEKTIADAKAAQEAIERAVKVLQDYYTTAEESLLQTSGTAQAPFKGMQDAKAGVLGALDVLLSDFGRLEAETSAAEDEAASAFQNFMWESEQDAEVKQTEMKHNEARAQDAQQALLEAKSSLAFTQEELEKALDYYEKLKADCIDTGLSYEDRVKMREEEIQSLKEALAILAGEDLAA